MRENKMGSKLFLAVFLIISIPITAQNDIKIISSDRSSIVIEYSPSFFDSTVVPINNQNYIKYELKFGMVPDQQKWGEPLIPVRTLNIGVPSETGNTIQVISSAYKTVQGSLSPKPKLVKNGKETDFSYVIGKNYSTQSAEPEIVRFGKYGLMRSVPVQQIIISPMEYNAAQRVIKLYTKIRFRINFSGTQTIASKPAEDLIKGAIVNFNVAKYWTKKSASGTVLKKSSGVTGSVLSSGTWVRFEAPTEGIYMITKSMLSSYGIDPGTVDPRTIKIYNNGGKALPETLSVARPSDLVENAIYVNSENDSTLGEGGYILFYGRGNEFWDYDTANNHDTFVRYFHPYSNQNYYWITSGGTAGKRMKSQASLNVQSPYVQTSTKSFTQWQKPEINIGQTGREFYGDNFSQNTTSRTYITALNGRLNNYPINYNFSFVNASPDNCGLEIQESSTPLINTTLNGYAGDLDPEYGIMWANTNNISYTGSLTSVGSQLNFTFTPQASADQGYLYYFEIIYQQQLAAINNNLLFFSKDTTSVIQYDVTGFSSSQISIFNITDYANVSLLTGTSISGTECDFQANERAGRVSRYFGVGNSTYLTPTNPTTINTQNLHGNVTGAKFLIITNKVFESAAQGLASYKESSAPEPISTAVVDVDQIFNEFSCGMTDPTAIRDFIAYAYNNWQIPPDYVLFFGKGTYDHKNIQGSNNDYVPAYETEESLDQIYSYTMDDYFVEVSGDDDIIDIPYGRITVETATDATSIISKIIQYETQINKGPWQNLISLSAQDGWHGTQGWQGNNATIFTNDCEILANSYIPPSYDLNKIYLAAYNTVFTSDGRKIPDAYNAIISTINSGTLIMNWIGHGSPSLWADEEVFVQSTTIPQLHNSNYFFCVAATCDFGYWDIPNYQSSSEELVLLHNAGSIGAFSSCRATYEPNNSSLDEQLFTDLLTLPRDTNYLPVTLGQAIYYTKQAYYDVNSQKYELIGDPTLRLQIPQYTATIDSIDGQALSSSAVQIKALSKTRISGEIRKPDNSLWNSFNGSAILTMYDSQRTFDLVNLLDFPILLQGGTIFNGNISVTNGKFSTSFTVPKDISYGNDTGKVVVYFYNSSSNGLGYTKNIIVGGTDSTVVVNTVGPTIRIFFDDTTTTNPRLVNPNSTLIVKIYDANGLNTTGTGIGHKLEGILNGNANNPIDFTNYFTSDLNSGGKSGTINYQFNGLEPGDYSLKVIAWDVFNNSSNATANFDVVNSSGLVINDVYNYPDPFASNTTFTFQQNLAAAINVKIKIYTVAGRLIREIESNGITSKFVKVDWDGRDQDGSLIANGTYLYKVIVHSVDGQYSQSALGKLAKVR
jgi:hypothetical protein